jgi:hypothetical protein
MAAARPRTPRATAVRTSLSRAFATLAFVASLIASFLWGERSSLAFCRTTSCTCASEASCATECPKDEDGCPTKGKPLAWSGACTGFALDVQGTSTLSEDQWTDAIVEAFNTWTGVDCGDGQPPSFDLLQLRNVSCGESQYNASGPNVNVVYFDDNGWSGTGIDGTLASTTVTFSNSGQILDADMAINSARNDFTVGDDDVQTDLVSVVTHEVGHFLGIAHSPYPNAVMYAYYTPGTIKRTLTADDIAAVCNVYPPKTSAGACNPIPPGGLETTCDADTTSSSGGGCTASRTKDEGGPGLAVIAGALGLVLTRGFFGRRRETQ